MTNSSDVTNNRNNRKKKSQEAEKEINPATGNTAYVSELESLKGTRAQTQIRSIKFRRPNKFRNINEKKRMER